MENLQALTNGRAGQCYRIALAIIEVGSDALVLVHGRVDGIEHAWIEDGFRIYDPVAHALIDSANYPAVTDHRYTKAQALKLAASTGHCGPWKRLEEIQTMTEAETIRLVANAYVQTALQAGTSITDLIEFAERTRGKDSTWAGVVRTIARGLPRD